MKTSVLQSRVNGIEVCHPVVVDKAYLLSTVDYSIKNGINHIQYVGPIHDGIKGNIDGMTMFRKYSRFNDNKDLDYVRESIDAVNEACNKAHIHGIDMYAWHHELDLPHNFKEVYPDVVNSYGDIEVTHPLVRDFLENRIMDFFSTYPNMRGIVLTLHETKIPLLRLKEQKLDRTERVKYITEILYRCCKSLGKELIVRPFASIAEDYEVMTRAYESISEDLIIMDKWTQFDWSLTLPDNAFYKKIKKNPILVETDIFGEYFGKGRLPIMLKNHIEKKYEYCETYCPIGYNSRIDRNGQHPFGDVNEVNNEIISACIGNRDVDKAIDDFFARKYPEAPHRVKAIMEKTENVLIEIMYLDGYYFTEGSLFPTLNHSKNHYYFEIMKEEYSLLSNEWYIPVNWKRPPIEKLIAEKESAISDARELLEEVTALKGVISDEEYGKLWVKFANLYYIAHAWYYLTLIISDYARFFEIRDDKYRYSMEDNIHKLAEIDRRAAEELGNKFYCLNSSDGTYFEYIGAFADDVLRSFELERNTISLIEKEDCLTDYVVCGGGAEGHQLLKEVNFSDTAIRDGMLCRIPGSLRGMNWCSINAHGWFSYLVRMVPNRENTIKILAGSYCEYIDVKVTVGDEEYEFREKSEGKKELTVTYTPKEGEDSVRIRFDKISPNTPCIYTIKVY